MTVNKVNYMQCWNLIAKLLQWLVGRFIHFIAWIRRRRWLQQIRIYNFLAGRFCELTGWTTEPTHFLSFSFGDRKFLSSGAETWFFVLVFLLFFSFSCPFSFCSSSMSFFFSTVWEGRTWCSEDQTRPEDDSSNVSLTSTSTTDQPTD